MPLRSRARLPNVDYLLLLGIMLEHCTDGVIHSYDLQVRQRGHLV